MLLASLQKDISQIGKASKISRVKFTTVHTGLRISKQALVRSALTRQLTIDRVDLKGKKVAVIGTGATGVQLAQEVGQQAASTTVFVRTPNLCLPMRQRKISKEEQDNDKHTYPECVRLPLSISERTTTDTCCGQTDTSSTA